MREQEGSGRLKVEMRWSEGALKRRVVAGEARGWRRQRQALQHTDNTGCLIPILGHSLMRKQRSLLSTSPRGISEKLYDPLIIHTPVLNDCCMIIIGDTMRTEGGCDEEETTYAVDIGLEGSA